MDDTDFKIIKKLFVNARYTYRELANALGVSTAAIHKRVQNLFDSKIIHAFLARPSPQSLKYLEIAINGQSASKDLENLARAVGKEEHVYRMAVSDDNTILISGILRDITELEPFTQFNTKTCELNSPFVGIVNIEYPTQAQP